MVQTMAANYPELTNANNTENNNESNPTNYHPGGAGGSGGAASEAYNAGGGTVLSCNWYKTVTFRTLQPQPQLELVELERLAQEQ